MRVYTPSTLRAHWKRYADAEGPLRAWLADAEKTSWRSPQDIKADYASASILSDDRVVFNIKGNTYRLIVVVSYAYQVVLVKFFGTHAEYDKIDAMTVGLPQPKSGTNQAKPKAEAEEDL